MKRRKKNDGGGIVEDGITSYKGHWHGKDTIIYRYVPRKLLYLILQSPFLQEVP
jgi:hypothetical protein